MQSSQQLTPEQKRAEYRAKLLGSLLLFTRTFFKLRTGREFNLTYPAGRESHIITICKVLTQIRKGELQNTIINIPPRYGKTELLIHFVPWCLGLYPDSNFIYVSYAHGLAKKQTQTIREIIQLPYYRNTFGISITEDTSAKDNFEVDQGGSVYAVGAEGTITGRGAGVQGVDRFGGAVIIDDIHKPVEVHSDTIRNAVIDWYDNTLQSRINNRKTPIIFIGQRLHENDLAAKLISEGWHLISIPALDVVGNALNPEMHTKEDLLLMQRNKPYLFYSQYQQTPQPPGGSIYKEEDFLILDEEPNIFATFITADTAETEKTYNDATVFSFWGLYRIKHGDHDTGLYGLHWLDCRELRVEPRYLESEFRQFYAECLLHPIKPKLAAIEKKSTGVTLLSVVKDIQGLKILDVERLKKDGSKTERFLSIQPYIAGKQVTFTSGAHHIKLCVEHCKKITANNTHAFDDIADTLYDAIKIGLIDKTVPVIYEDKRAVNQAAQYISNRYQRLNNLRKGQYGARS
jgi:predicted phage terminase large subunit-like protein